MAMKSERREMIVKRALKTRAAKEREQRFRFPENGLSEWRVVRYGDLHRCV
jgi:hypothetical protein